MASRGHQTEVIDDGSLHAYRTEIPNTIVRGLKGQDLSVYAKWLYVYLKSVAGDRRECYQGTRMIAKGSGISAGKISGAKDELEKAGLIVVTNGKNPNRDPDRIRMKDIWLANMQEFSTVHEMNTTESSQTIPQEGVSTSGVHDMNTENQPGVHHMNSGVHHMNSGVHHMNERRSHEEDPMKKEESVREITPASPLVETSPQGDTPTPKRAKAPQKPAGSKRCPEDYTPTPAVIEWAQVKFPQVEFAEALDAMRDWEFKDTRHDWDAVLRTWIRNEAKRSSAGMAPRVSTHHTDLRFSAKGQYNLATTEQFLQEVGYYDVPGREGVQSLPRPTGGGL